VSTPDPLAGLRDQIRTLTEAAERLVRDVGAATGRADAPAAPARPHQQPPPPAGWHQSAPAGAPAELAGLLRLLELLGEILPAELHAPLIDLVRELLVLLRALIDWAVARLEAPDRGREVEVEDIPII
jgi:hypothetical protein